MNEDLKELLFFGAGLCIVFGVIVAAAISTSPSEAEVQARAARFCQLAQCEVVSCRIQKINGNRCTVRTASNLQAIDCDDDICYVMAGERNNDTTVIIQQPASR